MQHLESLEDDYCVGETVAPIEFNEMIAQIGNEFNKADSQSLPSREEMHRPLRPRAASPREMLESI